MSETEIIGSLPTPNEYVPDGDRIVAWRPLLSSISVVPLDGGRKRLVLDLGGQREHLDLSPSAARRLASLLGADPDGASDTGSHHADDHASRHGAGS